MNCRLSQVNLFFQLYSSLDNDWRTSLEVWGMVNSSSFCYALKSETCGPIEVLRMSLIYTLQQLRSTNNLVSVNNKAEIKTAMAKFLWVTIPNFQMLSE